MMTMMKMKKKRKNISLRITKIKSKLEESTNWKSKFH